MLRRHLGWIRALMASGFLTGSFLGASAETWAAEPDADAPIAVVMKSDSISILDAKKSGDLGVKARGDGQYHVKLLLKNNTSKRLNVIIPPGLIASSSTAQGGRGGFQSMGLGSVRNAPGGFGEFRGAGLSGTTSFRSVGVKPEADRTIAIPAGESVEVPMPSVCLNYGIPTPTHKDYFELVAVEDYTKDTRIHKALKSLVVLGTSQGVAQAAMWRVCNDVPFETMANEPNKVMNTYEISLASRFVDALDSSGSSELIDSAYLTEGRLFVRVNGEDVRKKDADRLTSEIEGQSILGLRARSYSEASVSKVQGPALLFDIKLTDSKSGEARAKVAISLTNDGQNWKSIGKFSITDPTTLNAFDGQGLAVDLDREVASNFVSVKSTGHGKGVSTFKLENRLPFTLASVSLKTGRSLGSAVIPYNGVGIAPTRATSIEIAAPMVIVDHVELNGL